MLWTLLAALAAAAPTAAEPIAVPDIVPRAAWGAKPADTGLMQAQAPREIVIHHTAEPQRPDQSLAQQLQRLQRFSRTAGEVEGRPKPAWGDVPYHFYIDAAGHIGEGRSVAYAGDTNTRYSTANRIQIVLDGHFDKEQPSAAQLRSLDRLVVWLAAKYRVPAARISGHNDHVTTDCPGRNLKSYLPELRDKVAKASSVK
jgi:N-acetyl-anhydromuramyl-L-alanine amidase AmpD